MKKENTVKDKTLFSLVETFLDKLGFKILYWNGNDSTNGVDCWVSKSNSKPLSVEIKRARLRNIKNSVLLCVDPVSKCRLNDDLIAIIINDQYVLIEPMKDHISACSKTGIRALTLLV